MDGFKRVTKRIASAAIPATLFAVLLSSCSSSTEHPAAQPKQTEHRSENEPNPALEKIITIEFPDDGYTFDFATVAKGVSIEYKIVVHEDCRGLMPQTFGPSFAEPPGPSKLHPRERISGGGHSYCLEDFGLAPPSPKNSEAPIELKKGVYTHRVDWDGRNWSGPSDTSNPKGIPFPAGAYDLSVRIHGSRLTDQGVVNYDIERKTRLTLK